MPGRDRRQPVEPGDGPWDAGLQPERTTLAWIRTALTLTVVSLLTARLAGESGPLAAAVGLGGTTVAALLVAVQRRRHYRRDRTLRAGVTLDPAVGPVLGAALLTTTLAVAALGLLVAPLLR